MWDVQNENEVVCPLCLYKKRVSEWMEMCILTKKKELNHIQLKQSDPQGSCFLSSQVKKWKLSTHSIFFSFLLALVRSTTKTNRYITRSTFFPTYIFLLDYTKLNKKFDGCFLWAFINKGNLIDTILTFRKLQNLKKWFFKYYLSEMDDF
jgi:hypothetical protein